MLSISLELKVTDVSYPFCLENPTRTLYSYVCIMWC